jgi:hypothetical protein
MAIRQAAARELLTHKGNQQDTSLTWRGTASANRQLIMQLLHDT